jgi:hypothetical protein|tara:strand:- start:474 stop:662 length:189 start_codon:yes stop_codon:yes gene_type:complete
MSDLRKELSSKVNQLESIRKKGEKVDPLLFLYAFDNALKVATKLKKQSDNQKQPTGCTLCAE